MKTDINKDDIMVKTFRAVHTWGSGKLLEDSVDACTSCIWHLRGTASATRKLRV